MLHLAPFVGRNSFPTLLHERSLIGFAVEVGTHRGEFAEALLSTWQGERLYCVDPYLSGYNDKDPVSHSNRDDDYLEAMRVLQPFHRRVSMVRMTSLEAARDFGKGSLDFVYIDGNHDFEYVNDDIYAWWPKLRFGGVLAGHDFLCPGEINGGWGQYVQRAVLGFTSKKGIDVHLVLEEDGSPWSFYMLKE